MEPRNMHMNQNAGYLTPKESQHKWNETVKKNWCKKVNVGTRNAYVTS